MPAFVHRRLDRRRPALGRSLGLVGRRPRRVALDPHLCLPADRAVGVLAFGDTCHRAQPRKSALGATTIRIRRILCHGCATDRGAVSGRMQRFEIYGYLAPRDGFEPPTNGLTVRRSTTELPGNSERSRIVGKRGGEVKKRGWTLRTLAPRPPSRPGRAGDSQARGASRPLGAGRSQHALHALQGVGEGLEAAGEG